MLSFGSCLFGQDCPRTNIWSLFVTEPPSWPDVLGLTLHPLQIPHFTALLGGCVQDSFVLSLPILPSQKPHGKAKAN